jgi:c-di-GMP-binding flagellar brake protein YcgR
MADENAEIIRGMKIIKHMIQNLIDSKQTSSMRIPGTQFNWITYFLQIREDENLPLILVDHVKGFEVALARGLTRKISFEFKDKLGVPCRFETIVTESGPGGIWLEFPQAIQRIERRKYFRIEAPIDSVITFSLPNGDNAAASVQNLGAGGIAIRFSKEGVIRVGDELKQIRLKIPGGDREAAVKFEIPDAVVKRVEKMEGGKALVAIEFKEISENSRKKIIACVLKIQRVGLRRLGQLGG